MDEVDLSNPLAVITAFFGILITSLAFIVKLVPIFFASAGLLGGIIGLFGAVGILLKILLGD